QEAQKASPTPCSPTRGGDAFEAHPGEQNNSCDEKPESRQQERRYLFDTDADGQKSRSPDKVNDGEGQQHLPGCRSDVRKSYGFRRTHHISITHSRPFIEFLQTRRMLIRLLEILMRLTILLNEHRLPRAGVAIGLWPRTRHNAQSTDSITGDYSFSRVKSW